LRTYISKRYIDLGSDLTLGIVRDAYPSRLGDALKASGNVNAVTEDVVIIVNDIANVDANAKFDPSILRYGGVLVGHPALDLNCAADCIDGAGELDQHAVASSLNDAAPMSGYSGINEGLSDGL
jgi:hypothetical protein